jgi:predicted ATP-dependent Lon-type protease
MVKIEMGFDKRAISIIEKILPAICNEYHKGIWDREEALNLIEQWKDNAENLIKDVSHNDEQEKLRKMLERVYYHLVNNVTTKKPEFLRIYG